MAAEGAGWRSTRSMLYPAPWLVRGVMQLSIEAQCPFVGGRWGLRRRQLKLILAGKMKPDEATELKAWFVEPKAFQ